MRRSPVSRALSEARSLRRPWRRLLPALILIPLAVLMRPVTWTILDNRFYSFFQAKRAAPNWQSVAVVEIDEATRRESFSRPVFPLSGHLPEHAAVARKLAQCGARAVFFDLELSKDNFAQPPDSLAAAFREAGNIYLPLSLRTHSAPGGWSVTVARQPDSVLARASRGVFVVDISLDPDGTARRFRSPPFLRRLGLKTIPEELSGFHLTTPVPILFPSVKRPLPRVSYQEVLKGDPAATALLAGRIVFVGMSGAEAEDFVAVPGLQDLGGGITAYGLPGVDVLAATTETLVRGAPLRDASPLAVAGWLLLWCAGVVLVLPRKRPLTDVAMMAGWILLALAVTGMFHVLGNTIFPAGLLLGALLMCGAYALMATHVDTLRDLHASELRSAAMRRELALARENQERFLPKSMPELPGYGLWGVNVSSAAVSGDYYDVIYRPVENRLLLAIADVSGKGLPASLVMSNVQAALHSQAMRPDFDLAAAVGTLNTLLCRNTDAATFVTMFLGELDCASGRLRFVRAGHDLPVLVSADGSARTLDAGGVFLGMFPGMPYDVEETFFAPGDTFCLYTDGVTEARSPAQEEFGLERLIEILKNHRAEDAAAVGSAVRRSVEAFSGLAVQADDMTLLIVRTQPLAGTGHASSSGG
jgi:CHASE2 domain-containing sensor protein